VKNRGCDCQHVLDVGLAGGPDSAICRYAEAHELIIISKDEDFFYLASQTGSKIKLIWVRLGNCRKAALLATFERLWPRIESHFEAGERIIEVR
jgi:predicted nuclease of predicted toxin-antitoxin system